jgi:hypothetical protein
MQGVVRTLLSLRADARFYDKFEEAATWEADEGTQSPVREVCIDFDKDVQDPIPARERELLKFVAGNLVEPTEQLFSAMKSTLQSCDAVLMEMCGHRQYLGPPPDISGDLASALVKLRKRLIAFASVQDSILASKRLPPTYAEHPEVVKLFAFCRPVTQVATAVEALAVKVNEMEQRKPKYPRFHLPSYPFRKSLFRTNAQVRHDRGGLTAGKLRLKQALQVRVSCTLSISIVSPLRVSGTITASCCCSHPMRSVPTGHCQGDASFPLG